MKTVTIAATGRANTASLLSAFSRLGYLARLSDDPDRIVMSDFAVLPGVGAFGPVAERLRSGGLAQAFTERFALGRPTLGICLGMQLFCESSEESPGAKGLALIPGEVRRLSEQLPLPQFGWNRVRDGEQDRGIWAYFANSFALTEAPPGWKAAWSDYGRRFVAGLERGPIMLFQYHPELSGASGMDALRRWLDTGAA